jgi:RHH-type transcriptional regulator, rel operon repressor / antitoxin RelB
MYSKGNAAMLALRLPADLEARLTALAEKTGRTKSFYARAAIEEYIEDLEDYFLAEERMKNFKPEDAIPLEQIMAELGLED